MGDDNKENAIYTIEHLLGRIRTSGTKNIEPVKTLIGLLLEKDPKEIYLTKEECLLFYDAILSYYIDDEKDLKMMLAVSGRLDGYRSISTATKRRSKVHNFSEKTTKYSDELDTYRKQEDALLKSVAEKLYEDWKANKIPEPIKKRVLGDNKSGTEDNNDEHVNSSQKTNTFIQIINLLLNKETITEQNIVQNNYQNILRNNEKQNQEKGHLQRDWPIIIAVCVLVLIILCIIVVWGSKVTIVNNIVNSSIQIVESSDTDFSDGVKVNNDTTMKIHEERSLLDLEYSNGDGRPLYTKKDIDAGALDSLVDVGKVKFNSIKDETAEWYDEQYFVGVRVDDGNHGKDNKWSHDSIIAKDGETYIIRAFVHNNTISDKNTWQEDGRGVAHNTKVAFNIPQISDTQINIHGIISATNAVPEEIRDNIVFNSENGEKFHLEYIYGSALEENNAIEPWYDAEGNRHTGRTISDDIVKAKSGGTSIGFENPNGELPGCYYFADLVSIKVRVVYDGIDNFTLHHTVRHLGTGNSWADHLEDVEIGEEIEYQIEYRNTGTYDQMNVMIVTLLPDCLEYIPGTTKLWNSNVDGATDRGDTIGTTGVNIGDYSPGANAYVRFRARVIDVGLAYGSNTKNNWVKGSTNDIVLQDVAAITVYKEESTK